MADLKNYGEYETAWCPGCGNFSILASLKTALADSGLEPRNVLLVSGIGQAAKTPHYLNANVFNGLHGRSMPVATAAKLVNPALTVVVESGDGCNYGEGGNHFLAAIRRNIDITAIVHNNQVYALTKGQTSPTSEPGFATKNQPGGSLSGSFNPVLAAVALGASFVARGFAGEGDHLAGLIKLAIAHKGFALIDVLQQCVSFNRLNTFKWHKDRCYKLGADYNPEDWPLALKTAAEWGDKIPIGLIYRASKPTFESHFPSDVLSRKVDIAALRKIIDEKYY